MSATGIDRSEDSYCHQCSCIKNQEPCVSCEYSGQRCDGICICCEEYRRTKFEKETQETEIPENSMKYIDLNFFKDIHPLQNARLLSEYFKKLLETPAESPRSPIPPAEIDPSFNLPSTSTSGNVYQEEYVTECLCLASAHPCHVCRFRGHTCPGPCDCPGIQTGNITENMQGESFFPGGQSENESILSQISEMRDTPGMYSVSVPGLIWEPSSTIMSTPTNLSTFSPRGSYNVNIETVSPSGPSEREPTRMQMQQIHRETSHSTETSFMNTNYVQPVPSTSASQPAAQGHVSDSHRNVTYSNFPPSIPRIDSDQERMFQQGRSSMQKLQAGSEPLPDWFEERIPLYPYLQPSASHPIGEQEQMSQQQTRPIQNLQSAREPLLTLAEDNYPESTSRQNIEQEQMFQQVRLAQSTSSTLSANIPQRSSFLNMEYISPSVSSELGPNTMQMHQIHTENRYNTDNRFLDTSTEQTIPFSISSHPAVEEYVNFLCPQCSTARFGRSLRVESGNLQNMFSCINCGRVNSRQASRISPDLESTNFSRPRWYEERIPFYPFLQPSTFNPIGEQKQMSQQQASSIQDVQSTSAFVPNWSPGDSDPTLLYPYLPPSTPYLVGEQEQMFQQEASSTQSLQSSSAFDPNWTAGNLSQNDLSDHLPHSTSHIKGDQEQLSQQEVGSIQPSILRQLLEREEVKPPVTSASASLPQAHQSNHDSNEIALDLSTRSLSNSRAPSEEQAPQLRITISQILEKIGLMKLLETGPLESCCNVCVCKKTTYPCLSCYMDNYQCPGDCPCCVKKKSNTNVEKLKYTKRKSKTKELNQVKQFKITTTKGTTEAIKIVQQGAGTSSSQTQGTQRPNNSVQESSGNHSTTGAEIENSPSTSSDQSSTSNVPSTNPNICECEGGSKQCPVCKRKK